MQRADDGFGCLANRVGLLTRASRPRVEFLELSPRPISHFENDELSPEAIHPGAADDHIHAGQLGDGIGAAPEERTCHDGFGAHEYRRREVATVGKHETTDEQTESEEARSVAFD